MNLDPYNDIVDRLMIIIMVFGFWPIPSIPCLIFSVIQMLRGKM